MNRELPYFFPAMFSQKFNGIVQEPLSSGGRIIACDRVEVLSKTNAKRISVQGQVSLDSLEEIRDLKENDGVFSFLYGGDIHRLLETLSAGTITDLSISDPDLDEIFLHYYENGGEQV